VTTRLARGEYRPRVLLRLLVRWVVLAVAFMITAWILDGLEVTGGFGAYLWVALIFGVVNAILGTIIRLLTLPFIVLTLGLLAIVINAVLLEIVDALTDHLTIDDFFWTAIWAAIILAVVSVLLEFVLSLILRPAAAARR
jgi:putative membrane protein